MPFHNFKHPFHYLAPFVPFCTLINETISPCPIFFKCICLRSTYPSTISTTIPTTYKYSISPCSTGYPHRPTYHATYPTTQRKAEHASFDAAEHTAEPAAIFPTVDASIQATHGTAFEAADVATKFSAVQLSISTAIPTAVDAANEVRLSVCRGLSAYLFLILIPPSLTFTRVLNNQSYLFWQSLLLSQVSISTAISTAVDATIQTTYESSYITTHITTITNFTTIQVK